VNPKKLYLDRATDEHARSALLEDKLGSAQPELGFVYLERGCRLDSPHACTHFAIHLLKHETSKKRQDSALQVLERACNEAEVVDACVALADEYQSGRHVPGNVAEAARFRARACTLGQRDLCRGPAAPSPDAPEPKAPHQ
jgi:TPR repeat protein